MNDLLVENLTYLASFLLRESNVLLCPSTEQSLLVYRAGGLPQLLLVGTELDNSPKQGIVLQMNQLKKFNQVGRSFVFYYF